ncbi:MAG: hypothetical protein JW822_03355 [Spirochaetales bacterium]|nr:hypothetical protein [Spirochaetales bacterium]
MKEKRRFVSTNQERCRKSIPLALVLLDNVPTLILFILGTLIVSVLNPLYGTFYIIYSAFGIFWFWAKICPYCAHYDTLSCPCGYGFISAKLSKRKTGKEFKKVFRANIGILFPCWFIPPAVGTYLLLDYFSFYLLIYVVLFCIIGFLIIPLISKLAGCRNCEIKEDCPWMNKC